MPALSPSVLRAYLECEHRVWMDAYGDPARRRPVSAFQQMLFDDGLEHERARVASLEIPYVDLSDLPLAIREAATRDAIAAKAPLIYQARLVADGLVGEPDLLRWEGRGYVPVDIKSGRALDDDGGPVEKYGVQIALYVDLLQRLGVAGGAYGYIWDRYAAEVRYELHDPITEAPDVTLWSRYQALRSKVEPVLAGTLRTEPAAAAACKACPWKTACHEELEARDDLTLLPELGRAKRAALRATFPTIADLATADLTPHLKAKRSPFPGIGAATLKSLQARARLARDPAPEPFFREPVAWPVADVELYFDIEDDPIDALCYLHGFVIREAGRERYVGVFADAHTPDGEREAFVAAMDVFRAYPQALVLHYASYERTTYRKLQARHPGVCEVAEIDAIFAPARCVDLYAYAKKSEWPTRDLSVKSLAVFCGFAWRDESPSGAASVEWYRRYVASGDDALKRRILEYNEDDCRAMRVVADRMRGMAMRAL
jgi:uncharacterized protein